MIASRRIFYSCLVVGALLFGVQIVGSSLTVQAKTKEKTVESALMVSPAIIEKSLAPGETVSFKLTVRNITNSPLPITSFARAFTVQSTELEKTDGARLDASKWFAVQEPEFILQPNQERTVTGTIHPPTNAEPGGHYATVFLQPPVAQEEVYPSMARISARVGVLSFLTVKGEIVERARLTSGLESPKLIRSGSIDMKFRVVNTGNVHILPKGKVDIYDWQDKRVATIDVPTGLILPDATKEYTIPWTTSSVFGKYRAELSLEYGAKHLRLQNSATTFWVLPAAEILVGSLVLFAVILFVGKTYHRWGSAWRALRAPPPPK